MFVGIPLHERQWVEQGCLLANCFGPVEEFGEAVRVIPGRTQQRDVEATPVVGAVPLCDRCVRACRAQSGFQWTHIFVDVARGDCGDKGNYWLSHGLTII